MNNGVLQFRIKELTNRITTLETKLDQLIELVNSKYYPTPIINFPPLQIEKPPMRDEVTWQEMITDDKT